MMEKDRALNLLQNGLLPQVHGAYYEALKMVIDDWKTEPKTGKWIPVTKRLPEKNGKYLVTYEKEFVPDHVDDVNHYKTIGILDYSKRFGWLMISQKSVYAWMPLPEPFKAESEVICQN